MNTIIQAFTFCPKTVEQIQGGKGQLRKGKRLDAGHCVYVNQFTWLCGDKRPLKESQY